jgi:hypothetical protein
MTIIKNLSETTIPTCQLDKLFIAQSHGPVTNTAIELREVSWKLFCERMSQPKVGPKDGSYILRGGKLKGNQRANENLLGASLLVIDGDSHLHPEEGTICPGAPDFNVTKKALDSLSYRYFLHTTHSHRLGILTKWRLYLPVPIHNPEELRAAVDFMITLLHERGCMVAPAKENYAWAQPWFMPRLESEELLGGFQYSERLIGQPFDLALAVDQYNAKPHANETANKEDNPTRENQISYPDLTSQPSDLINRLRQAMPSITGILERHGYKYFPSNDRWLHPDSKSGVPGVTVFHGDDGIDRMISHHGSDPLCSTNAVFGSTAHDVIDIEIAYRFGTSEADWKIGFKQLCQEYDIFTASTEVRRDQQKEENRRIGAGDNNSFAPDIITLDQALKRFVFISDGSRVADLRHPRLDLSLSDFNNTFAASVAHDRKGDKHAITKLWRSNQSRQTVATRTFRAGAGEITTNPNDLSAVNTWRPIIRPQGDAALAAPFVSHIKWLFEGQADDFLDFLAHIEQKPGELPHTAWLHIAEKTGLGRNWIAGVLARVWPGYVAASLDAVQIIEGTFNGPLAGKLLAQVDEIREGGSTNGWRFSEKLKSTINEAVRTINPKYGRVTQEFNCCRWLFFSNHRSALRLTENDRRFNISICEAEPRDPEYYKSLYQLLEQPGFIPGVAALLAQRDISRFNPGARAKPSKGRSAVITESRSEAQELAAMVVEHWPCDLILTRDLGSIINGELLAITPAHRHAIEEAGLRRYDRPIKVHGHSERVYAVRNTAKWLEAAPSAISREISARYPQRQDSSTTWREWLELKSIE